MITIDDYTGEYQSAIRQSRISVKSHVLIHDNPDAREYNDFKAVLRAQGLMIGEFVRYFPRKKMSQCKLTRYMED